jgi:ribosomal protein S18 acetylase RimI-like enzyme
VRVERLESDAWQSKRDLRLAALKDAPSAFLATYETAAARTEADWRAWPKPETACCLGLVRDDALIGIAIVEETEPGTADVFAMWVAPDARGSGGVDALLAGAAQWAGERGVHTMRLEVRAGNSRALRAYTRNGFAVVDETPLAADGIVLRRAT